MTNMNKMKKISYIIISFLTMSLISCKTTNRPYPAAYYQCDKCGEAFEISKSIDEEDLECPDKTCEGKVQKVASYKRYGSGPNTRYGYSDPWDVGYSGPYVGSRGFLGVGFHGGGHHHHHYYHDDKHSKSGGKKSNRPPARKIVKSDSSKSNSTPMRRLHSGSNSSNAPSNSSKNFSRSIPSRSSSSSSGSPSRSIPSSSSSSSSKGSSGRRVNN